MQATVMSICKEKNKTFKNQQSNPVSEEEEETQDNDEEVDEMYFISQRESYINTDHIGYIRWPNTEKDYLSCIKKIPIPPPKF